MDRMSDFWAQQSVWSQNTFGLDSQRGPEGPALHLLKEVVECLHALGYDVSVDAVHTLRKPDQQAFQKEGIDCFFLVVDMLRRSPLNYEGFMDRAFEKLAINKQRSWPRTDGDASSPIEHDRTLDDKSTEKLSCPELETSQE